MGMARSQVSWGSLCYWTWRLLFMFILVSSFCSLSLILLVYFGQKRSGMPGLFGMVGMSGMTGMSGMSGITILEIK